MNCNIDACLLRWEKYCEIGSFPVDGFCNCNCHIKGDKQKTEFNKFKVGNSLVKMLDEMLGKGE